MARRAELSKAKYKEMLDANEQCKIAFVEYSKMWRDELGAESS